MKRLAILFIIQTIVCAVLAVWLIQETRDGSERGQRLYEIGLRDGEIYARGQIVRAQIEQEIIDEQRSKLAKEKL
jgi:hypothetical protein